ncbi:putative ribosome biogenesis protein [Neolecta irregularis DAH-3]|uniref:Putative ribosome biogenesis protein n=1 Tax=Neolecta irregularis (strain DAH-3) TaxID=1198029 RepID=A0A1U7LKX9_NEOID|nr:putative ribosome biogenesis protein [Neolecta irregularis DAH-3]|eukprot:OLL23315.1 putative ribosome biogenesis protein [Neolecta irregularis DAH-3]
MPSPKLQFQTKKYHKKALTARATKALLSHLKKQPVKVSKSLLELEAGIPIYLVLSTKKFISDEKKLKPQKIVIPHPILPDSSSICLITKDPQRTYKDLTASIPEIIRVIGISKLKAGKWKGYEQRRQLRDTHDLFLADDRIVRFLPSLLGKVFIEKKKLPIPIDISKEKKIYSEIKKALSSTLLILSQGNCTSVRVGHTGLTADHIKENIEAVVQHLISKVVSKGWEGIRSLHLKSPESTSLPIHVAEKLYGDEDILISENKKRPTEGVEPDSIPKKKLKSTKKAGEDIEAVEKTISGKKEKNVKSKKVTAAKPVNLVAV